ncbi:hypothetical protein BV20DRAFT_1051871 [Pilatotrama ljubarskyi]|nr:hypothetical protein BV20DRAFT_1051871 [Pilatotrama ljubarskyi]
MEGHKRKRDDEGTVVTFYAPDRTFQRVYKGQSLEETKSLVRKKLGLPEDASLRFSRLHEGRHIDLEDDDDFEAFRHQARYVPSLDVSVFVGNHGPSLFTQQPSVEAATIPATTQKRKKKRRAELRTPVTPSGPVIGRSTPTSVPPPPPLASTLDANGIPKKKRKRGEELQATNQEASAMRGTTVSLAGDARQEESSRPESVDAAAKPSKKSRKEAKSVSSAIPEPASPAVAAGSKRKRHESPEVPVARSDRPTAPPSSVMPPAPSSPAPSSPARKKRKKDKRSQEPQDTPPGSEASPAPVIKADKKSKRKAAAAASEQPPHIPDASEPPDGVAADVEDNIVPDEPPQKVKEKKEKKEKRKKSRSEDATEAASEVPAPSEKPSKQKRKHQDAEGLRESTSAPSGDLPTADPAGTAGESSKRVGVDQRDKKGKSKGPSLDAESMSLAVIDAPETGDVSSRVDPGKRKEKRKNKRAGSSEGRNEPSRTDEVPPTEESVPGPDSAPAVAVEAPLKEKKRKRRKTLAADTSVDPDLSVASSAGVPEAESVQADESAPTLVDGSTPKKKRSKKSITPAPVQDAESSSNSGLAAIQAAVQAVLARSKPASAPLAPIPAPAASEPAQPPPEPVLPARKRKAGKSKLRQAWGPEDIAADEEQSAPAAVQDTAVSSSQPTESISAAPSVPVEPDRPLSKAVNGKKARPSSAPACPICDKASVHPRSECPVVQGGPESIRKRISQLKKAEHDEELVDELEVLLKEAQRRRKSAGDRGLDKVPAPIETSVVPTASAETTPSPVFPLSVASFGSTPSSARPAPLPLVPAGSEISEVAVESKDEGSSNESSSDTDSEEEGEDREKDVVESSKPPPSASFALGSSSAQDLTSIDLEALLRGPIKPRGSILNQIPSESTSEDEGESTDDDARPDEDVDLSEEEKNDRAFRRLSRKLERAASSSDDDREPEPEVGNADMDVDDVVVPPTIMDVDPNAAIEEDAEAEAGIVNAEDVGPEGSSAGDEPSEQALKNQSAIAASKATTDQGYESDAEDAAAPQLSTREASQSSDASDPASAYEADRDASSVDRGDDSRVERAADVDGAVHTQESPEEPGEEASAAEPEPAKGADEEDAERSERDDAASVSEVEQETAPAPSATRELSPELGGEPEPQHKQPREVQEEPERTPSPPPLRQPDPVTAAVDMPTATSSAQASSLDLHPEDHPSDPIESLGSFADVSERRTALEDDPIENADGDEAELSGVQKRGVPRLAGDGTPPPASQRTPGTVSRMKDRYGRLVYANGREKLSSLSEQLLGALLPSQPELDVEMHGEDGEQVNTPEHGQESDNEKADAQGEAGQAESRPEPSESTQDEEGEEEQDEHVEMETRPRRVTRITTRRASAMPRSSSVPEPPASTPTPAPMPPPTAPAPKRRGARLTAEEKAAREAEKKAERERKAAEKKAEREAKAAEKKAEKEAKEAARKAEREAKEAAKRAEKEAKAEEGQKRGRARATRGRGATAKPVSTRARAAASAEVEEDGQEEGTTEEQNGAAEPADAPVTATPGFSKVSWTTLPSTEPRTQPDSQADSSMIDELQPSSPDRSLPRATNSPEPISHNTTTTDKDEGDVSREVTITQDRSADQDRTVAEDANAPAATPKPNGHEKEPLFIPSSSQFPNTPFELPEGGLPESTPYANGKGHDGSGSDDGADADDDVFEAPKTRPRAAWMADAPYRRLSDIATQQLFTPSQIPSPALFPASQSQRRASNAGYGRPEDEDDDDDDDSDEGTSSGSDSEAGAKKSHIPQERRAGAGVQKRKKSALLSFGS